MTGSVHDEAGRVPNAEEVAHQLAIQQVLATHSRGVDRADESLLKSAYWSDATVAYGSFNGLAHEFCAMLPSAIRRFRLTQHALSNSLIRLEHTVAQVETYVTAYHYLSGEDDQPDTEMTFLGRYLDRFELREAVWKIAHRQVVMDWNQNAATTAQWEGRTFSGLARGRNDAKDPLYAMLGTLNALP